MFGFGFTPGLKTRVGSELNPFVPPDNAVVTTTTGDYIVSVDGKYILTVEGFVPLKAMRTLDGHPVITKNNDYITI